MKDIIIDKTGWKKWRFGDVAIQTKGIVDIDNTDLTRYIAGEHMNSEDIHLRKWGNVGDGYLGPAFIRRFNKGDILYGSRRTYLKKVAIADFDGITANTTFVIKAKEELIEPILLVHLMLSDSFTEYSVKNSRGSVNPYINWKDIADYEFLLPPKAEQKRLAELLWAADEMIEKEKKELNLIEDLYYSIISSIFNNQKIYCDLGSLCEIKSGVAFPLKYQGHKDLPIPFFKVSDMNHPRNKYEMQVSENYVDDGLLKIIKGQTYPVGSLIFPKIGATIYTDKKRLLLYNSVVDNNIMVIIPNQGQLEPRFLFYFFNTFKLVDIINTGTVPTISSETVRYIQIPDLEIEQQEKIVNEIDVIIKMMKQQEQLVEQSKQIKLYLINKVF